MKKILISIVRSFMVWSVALIWLPVAATTTTTAAAAAAAAAAAEERIAFQGFLQIVDGETIVTMHGNAELKFELFESAEATAGEEVVWGEVQTVTVIGGRFSTTLGGGKTLPMSEIEANDLEYAFAGKERYLQVTVLSGDNLPNGAVVLPRQRIGTVAFALTSKGGVPPGTIAPHAGASVPEGWVLCDGDLYDGSNPKFRALFSVIGTRFGGGGAPTEFLVPDLQGRGVVGTTSLKPVGTTYGSETHSLKMAEMPAHKHNAREAGNGHSHRLRRPGNIGDNNNHIGSQFVLDWNDGAGDTSRRTQKVSTNIVNRIQGRGDPFSLMQPSLVLNYIIKL